MAAGDTIQASGNISSLLSLMKLLRSAQGCPWDKEQTNETLVPYTLEEAYEVADAVYSKQGNKICEELGDLLLQIVFHSQIASEEKQFEFEDVVLSITQKLIRRHPHIFAGFSAESPEEVSKIWQQVKGQEAETRAKSKVPPLPALLLLQKISHKVTPDTSADPLIRELIDLTKRAAKENRCLEAEVKLFCANFCL